MSAANDDNNLKTSAALPIDTELSGRVPVSMRADTIEQNTERSRARPREIFQKLMDFYAEARATDSTDVSGRARLTIVFTKAAKDAVLKGLHDSKYHASGGSPDNSFLVWQRDATECNYCPFCLLRFFSGRVDVLHDMVESEARASRAVPEHSFLTKSAKWFSNPNLYNAIVAHRDCDVCS